MTYIDMCMCVLNIALIFSDFYIFNLKKYRFFVLCKSIIYVTYAAVVLITLSTVKSDLIKVR